MNANDLRAIIASPEFKTELSEMSCFLASIKQERPIVYCLAKQIWRGRRHVFQLESKLKDLVVDGKRIEFKFHYDCDMEKLENEIKKHGTAPLTEMWNAVRAKKLSKSWSVMPQIFEEFCVREPKVDIFVWIICSRDLSKLATQVCGRVCWSTEQYKWHRKYPDAAKSRAYVKVADEYLERLRQVRPCAALLKEDIEIAATPDWKDSFPSVYHFRICEFERTS